MDQASRGKRGRGTIDYATRRSLVTKAGHPPSPSTTDTHEHTYIQTHRRICTHAHTHRLPWRDLSLSPHALAPAPALPLCTPSSLHPVWLSACRGLPALPAYFCLMECLLYRPSDIHHHQLYSHFPFIHCHLLLILTPKKYCTILYYFSPQVFLYYDFHKCSRNTIKFPCLGLLSLETI